MIQATLFDAPVRVKRATAYEKLKARCKVIQENSKKTVPVLKSVQGHVHIFTSPPSALEEKHGYTKEGWGRHYICLGAGKWNNPGKCWVDKGWDRRCDASRWAKRAGAKSIKHWWQC